MAKRSYVELPEGPLCVDGSLDRDVIVSGGKDNLVRVWDSELRSIAVLEGHDDWVETAVVSQRGDIALTAGRDQTVRIWSLNSAADGADPELGAELESLKASHADLAKKVALLDEAGASADVLGAS